MNAQSLQSMAALAAAPRCQPLHERPRAAAASGSLRLCSKGPANVALAGRSALRRQQLQSAPRTAAAEAAVAGRRCEWGPVCFFCHCGLLANQTHCYSADDGASQARASQLVDQVLEAIKDTGKLLALPWLQWKAQAACIRHPLVLITL